MTVMVPLVSSPKCKEPFMWLGRLKTHITFSFNPHFIIIKKIKIMKSCYSFVWWTILALFLFTENPHFPSVTNFISAIFNLKAVESNNWGFGITKFQSLCQIKLSYGLRRLGSNTVESKYTTVQNLVSVRICFLMFLKAFTWKGIQ